MIRRASAESQADNTLSRDRRERDIDEYVYDEDNFVTSNKKLNNVSYSKYIFQHQFQDTIHLNLFNYEIKLLFFSKYRGQKESG